MTNQTAGQKAAATRKARKLQQLAQGALFIATPKGYREARAEEILDAAARYFVAERTGQKFDAPRDAVPMCRQLCGARPAERFCALFLDTRHQLISAEVLFEGTVDGATVYPREVVRQALLRNAAAVIFTHNHPSGVSSPSEADRSITLKLQKALALVEIRLLDHIVITNTGHSSLAEMGWM